MIEYSEALRRNKMRFFIFNHTCSINAHGKNFNLPFFRSRGETAEVGVRKPMFRRERMCCD